MHAQMIWNLFQAVLHHPAIDSIPHRLLKNSHIPGLGLKLIVA